MATRNPNSIHFLANRLRALREQADLTQETFAEYADIGYKDYQNIEAGRRWNPQWTSLKRLASLHGLTMRQFLAEEMPTSILTWKKPLRFWGKKLKQKGKYRK